ncbi:MAG TPA: metallophosphoesterase [Kofleriaceae bacterium]|nr:metallophosphoesterase [Kofleriaceae bacterium]
MWVVRILIWLAITGSFHYYVWRRIVRETEMSPRVRRIVTIVMIAMWLLVPITTWSRLWWPAFGHVMGWITLPWLAFVGLATVALLALELPRRVAHRSSNLGVTRREFLARVTGGTAAVVAGSSVAGGIASARGEHEVVDVEVRLARLPRALDGFTIVQLSDLHTGLTIDRAFVQRVVDHANGLAPDLIALTGDLVDGPVADLREDIAPLAALRAKHGVFAVTGNHEYYAGADAWIAEITRLGARYLRNERVTIAPGLELAGVDDYGADKYEGHGEDLPRATAGRDPSAALVLLAHQPRQVKKAAQHGVDLQLSGHTHGGQIWPWHYIVKLQQGGLLAGHYDHAGTQLYVTRGCGYWGPPVRLLAPLEITRIILRAA